MDISNIDRLVNSAKKECLFSGAAAKMLGISKSTLFAWHKKKILVPEVVQYGELMIRVYFKYEIEYLMANPEKFNIRKKFKSKS